MKRAAGQVTIFISLTMMCIFALFCVLIESARTAGARWYLQTAASSALDSVFSQYHRELWDSYRLLFAEYDEEEELKTDFAVFLNAYLETGKWYPMTLTDTEVEEWVTAVDSHGSYLEKEILDYMAVGIWKLDYESETAEELWNMSKEAAAIKNIGDCYDGHSREVLELEESLEDISDNLNNQESERKEAGSCLSDYDSSGFYRAAEKLIQEMEKVPGLVTVYQEKADILAENLRESRSYYEGQKDDCTDEIQSKFEEEIGQYESYISEDGDRRQEVEALTELSKEQIALVQEVIEEVKEVEEIIDEWDGGEDDEDDLDIDELWSPVIRHFERLKIAELSFRHGIADKEKEGWLKNIKTLIQNGILKLVLPEDREVSENILDTTELPSALEECAQGARTITLLNHLIVNEYCGSFFKNFCDRGTTGGGEAEPDGETEALNGELLMYEMEYLIGGADSDRENLTTTVERLFAVREGLNLAYLLTDSEKREEARTLAMTVTGITGLAPLVLITTFFILCVWAAGEALMDIRGLLSGKKVPIWKSAETWTLTMESLLAAGETGTIGTGGGEQGLTYQSWLKLLLYADDIVIQEYRMMDMIQMNLRQKQNSFRMRRGIYQTKIQCELNGKHVFFSPGFVENLTGNREYGYPMQITAERVY
ncbi:MAG: DUF5702 domain-containing protein [Clostridiales bacterium]|nr:DUF5702 domain-containing protein [Clostridiales bacterium]